MSKDIFLDVAEHEKQLIFGSFFKNIADSSCFLQEMFDVPAQTQRVCGVYFLIKNNEVVYVGQSKDLVWRSWSHSRILPPSSDYKEFDRVIAVKVPEQFLSFVEAAFTAKLKPKYNGFKNKKTNSCGEYCVRNKLAFTNPDKAIQVFNQFKQSQFIDEYGMPLLVVHAENIIKNKKRDYKKVSQVQTARWEKFRRLKAAKQMGAACP